MCRLCGETQVEQVFGVGTNTGDWVRPGQGHLCDIYSVTLWPVRAPSWVGIGHPVDLGKTMRRRNVTKRWSREQSGSRH